MQFARIFAALALGATALASTASAQAPRARAKELPRTYVGKPTTAKITAADLMTRLYIFADDSMMGREVGTVYNLKGTAYIEREVRRMGLVPAGDSGGYFQNLPLHVFSVNPSSTMLVNGAPLTMRTDFFAAGRLQRTLVLDGLPVIYGGSITDSTTWIPAADVAGKVVLLTIPANTRATRGIETLPGTRFFSAAAVMPISLDRLSAPILDFLGHRSVMGDDGPPSGPPAVMVTNRVASLIMGNLDSLRPGQMGKPLGGTIDYRMEQAPGRNVVALLPGSDVRLRNQYVAIGAHNDHIGYNRAPVDHDSVRALNMIARVQGADNPEPKSLTAEQSRRLRRMIDSLHTLHGVRMDSIYNGADDDGSGSVSVLEIAEAFAKSKIRAKRSILFVWHAGEEKGLWGSEYFTDHPTVSRDSIVAQLNMDMVGRGSRSDVTGETKEGTLTHGGAGYVQLVGSRRLSTELGDLIESVNTTGRLGFKFDYSMDANGHPQNIYCRSDHYEYARYGIPIVFVTTGGHADYHQVTDEPQYIDYERMARVDQLIHDAAWKIANLDHRIVVDHAKPDPKATCVQ